MDAPIAKRPEVGTTVEPTPLEDLCRIAAAEAAKQSTNKREEPK
jgi:hypothetical protein